MIFLFFHVLNLLFLSNAFLPKGFFPPPNIFYKRDHKIQLPTEERSALINNTQGFYGVVGPNKNFYKAKSLIELFSGDGVVQGVFIDSGNITFVNHIIETAKVKFDRKYWRFPNNMFLLTILSTLRLIPVSQGVANTALVHYADQTLALYETDSPYLLDVDFNKKKVSTIKKLNVPGINNFSGHTKKVGNLLETIDYDIFKREAIIYTLDKEMKIVQRIPVKTKYIPIVHDFIATEKYTIFIDSPLHIELDKILKKSMPVSLKRGKSTYIHVVNKHTNEIETFELLDSIYAFHLTNFKETQDKYMFESLQLDKLDFSDINFHPKLRKIVLNKNSKKVFNQKFENLEELDMDFPLKIDKTRTLFNLIGPNGFYGFAICKFTRIIKKIILDDTTIYGEPQIIQWKGEPHVIAFIKDKESNSLFVMNLNDYTFTTTNIPLEITQGFHSIFIPKQ